MDGHKVRANVKVEPLKFCYVHGVLLGLLLGLVLGYVMCAGTSGAQWSSDTTNAPGQYRQQNRYDSGGVTQTPAGPRYDYGTPTYERRNPC